MQADKGGCTVAMSKTDYISGTYQLLSDSNTYRSVNSDPTTKTQRHLNDIIKKLKSENEMSETTAKNLTIYKSICSKLYCLPKIHK